MPSFDCLPGQEVYCREFVLVSRDIQGVHVWKWCEYVSVRMSVCVYRQAGYEAVWWGGGGQMRVTLGAVQEDKGQHLPWAS